MMVNRCAGNGTSAPRDAPTLCVLHSGVLRLVHPCDFSDASAMCTKISCDPSLTKTPETKGKMHEAEVAQRCRISVRLLTLALPLTLVHASGFGSGESSWGTKGINKYIYIYICIFLHIYIYIRHHFCACVLCSVKPTRMIVSCCGGRV